MFLRSLAVIALGACAADAFAVSGTPMLRSAGSQRSAVSGVSALSMAKVNVQGVAQIECDREEVLRTALLDNGVELYYGMKGKFLNCNGGGQCGTCKVELVKGNVSGRTDAENKLLADKPASFRLACQTLVMGDIEIKNKPDA